MATPPALSDADFQAALLRLMPRGRVWRNDPGSNLSALAGALAPSWTRNTAAAAQVLIDASPATTQNLLVEWENSLGLPDPCTAPNPSIEQRQAAVRAKFGARGALTTAYFITLAAALGFTITITEFSPYTVDMPCDEPLLEPALIRGVADELGSHADASIATACHPIEDPDEGFNPNVVKVVLDRAGYALYFSRATIPWARDDFALTRDKLPLGLPLYRHYGLYAYRVGFLRHYPSLAPAGIERFEALEQLRALWHGYRIAVRVTQGTPAPGVDTQEDLDRVRALYAAGKV